VLARNELFFKWTLYGLAAAACILVQDALGQYLVIWGVIPFLYPLLAVIPAIYEGPVSGTAFSLAVGVVTDLLVPAPLPCFYTLVFPLCGLLAALLARYAVPQKALNVFLGAAIAFLLTDGFHCLLLWGRGQAAWKLGAWLMVRELCVTLPLAIPMTLLFRAVYRKVHIYD